MKFTPTEIEGVLIIDIEPIVDERGFFARAWCEAEFARTPPANPVEAIEYRLVRATRHATGLAFCGRSGRSEARALHKWCGLCGCSRYSAELCKLRSVDGSRAHCRQSPDAVCAAPLRTRLSNLVRSHRNAVSDVDQLRSRRHLRHSLRRSVVCDLLAARSLSYFICRSVVAAVFCKSVQTRFTRARDIVT